MLDKDSLTSRMREQWDSRIAHDYRYWMSDGVKNDDEMWETGERDFGILTEGLPRDTFRGQVALEVGCGVGRLLRASAAQFSQVIGFDVSEKALEEASRLLANLKNVELVLGDGLSLAPVEDNSIDFAYSFAALCSMPVAVIARYLIELSRVVKSGGNIRLQVYLGRAQDTCEADTLAIRSFEEQRFRQALEATGFVVQDVRELKLPFEISNPEAGSIAMIVSAVQVSSETTTVEELSSILVPGGEKTADDNWRGSMTEYLMAVARATQHVDCGNIPEAIAALEFAISCYGEPEVSVIETLEKLRERLAADNSRESVSASNTTESAQITFKKDNQWEREILPANLEIIKKRFPQLADELLKTHVSAAIELTHGNNGEPVLVYEGTPLDQIQKPARAGEVWVERLMNCSQFHATNEVVIAGFAGGYHIESLLGRSEKAIHVVEPNLEILKAALCARDCSQILRNLASLSTKVESLKNAVTISENAPPPHFVLHPQSQVVEGKALDEFRRGLWSSASADLLKPSIGVVGPLYGGSLPIAQYTTQALLELKQRAVYYDLSTFHQGYMELETRLKRKERKNPVQTQYVEMLSQFIVEAVTERPVDILICLAQAPMSGEALTELRARGIITVMWFVEDCRRFQTWKDIARYYDYMFLIQNDVFPRAVEAFGAGKGLYLPVGCDANFHSPLELSEEERARWGSQISFVGAGYNNRQQMFARLANRDFKIWGCDWPLVPPFSRLVQNQGQRITPEDYLKVFNASSINLNLHSSAERDSVDPFGDFVNPRTFELASVGAFQLADNRKLLPDMFTPGKDIITFDDSNDLNAKIDYYLAHPEIRVEVAERARTRALESHTYKHRLESMLSMIYADKYEHIASRIKNNPWNKTLERAGKYPELQSCFKKVYDRGGEPELEELVSDVMQGEGGLNDTEKKILFLHHIKSQIAYVKKVRDI